MKKKVQPTTDWKKKISVQLLKQIEDKAKSAAHNTWGEFAMRVHSFAVNPFHAKLSATELIESVTGIIKGKSLPETIPNSLIESEIQNAINEIVNSKERKKENASS